MQAYATVDGFFHTTSRLLMPQVHHSFHRPLLLSCKLKIKALPHWPRTYPLTGCLERVQIPPRMSGCSMRPAPLVPLIFLHSGADLLILAIPPHPPAPSKMQPCIIEYSFPPQNTVGKKLGCFPPPEILFPKPTVNDPCEIVCF